MKLNKEYWEARYLNNETGWDAGSITTPLKDYIDQLTDKSIRILIPGAGNGYEFDYLVSKGFHNVWVIDFAQQPLDNLKLRNPEFENHFIHKNFFEQEDTFDLIIEQTFFCALNPELRKEYAKKMYDLLNLNGKISGLFFDFPLTEAGPPFGGSYDEYLNLFSELFQIKTLEKSYNSIKPRDGKELFFIFEKK